MEDCSVWVNFSYSEISNQTVNFFYNIFLPLSLKGLIALILMSRPFLREAALSKEVDKDEVKLKLLKEVLVYVKLFSKRGNERQGSKICF